MPANEIRSGSLKSLQESNPQETVQVEFRLFNDQYFWCVNLNQTVGSLSKAVSLDIFEDSKGKKKKTTKTRPILLPLFCFLSLGELSWNLSLLTLSETYCGNCQEKAMLIIGICVLCFPGIMQSQDSCSFLLAVTVAAI